MSNSLQPPWTVAFQAPLSVEFSRQELEPRQKKLKVKESKLPNGSVGKESICNAVDPGSIPGSGRSAGEGIGYPLQYSWASLVAQLIKNLPTM